MTKFLYFDVATTGLWAYRKTLNDPSQPRMVRLAWWLPPHDPQSYLIKLPPTYPISPEATANSHGITEETCRKSGTDLTDVMVAFTSDVGNADMVACFSAEFHRNVVESSALLTAVHLEWPRKPLDLMWASTPIMRKPTRQGTGAYAYPKLGEAYEYFAGIPMERWQERTPIERGKYIVQCLHDIHVGIEAAQGASL